MTIESIGQKTYLWAFLAEVKGQPEPVVAVAEGPNLDHAIAAFRADKRIVRVTLFEMKNPHIGPHAKGACVPIALGQQHVARVRAATVSIADQVRQP